MFDQLIVQSRSRPNYDPVALFLGDKASSFLDGSRASISGRSPDFYNINSNLSVAFDEAVTVADMVDGWADGLAEVCEFSSAVAGAGRGWVMGSDSSFTLSVEQVEQVLAERELEIPPRKTGSNLGYRAAFGLSALLYISHNLHTLILNGHPLTDLGVAAMGLALLARPDSPLQALYLASTGAGERSCRVLVSVLQTHQTLTVLDLRSNPLLDAEARRELTRAAQQRARMRLIGCDP
mmetsp:Transcript_86989/g.173713  ORF Transcript_86989/g.173713 Transcript_86989/m.173713 type:complete len:237 (-) Transcript_86989:217-927(-)